MARMGERSPWFALRSVPDGEQELLAVGNFAAATAPVAETPAATGTAGPEVSGPLPLPYSLPD